MSSLIDFKDKKASEICKDKYKYKVKECSIDDYDGIYEVILIVLEDIQTCKVIDIPKFNKLFFTKSMINNEKNTRLNFAKIICMFLNSIFYQRQDYERSKIAEKVKNLDRIEDLKIDDGNFFMNDYKYGRCGKSKLKSRGSVEYVEKILTSFYLYLYSSGIYKMKYLKEEYFRYKSARYKRGQHFAGKVVLESPFTVKYPKYCEKGRLEYISFYALTEFICLALKHYPMIALGIAAQAFAGLRKGEVTNMSWNNIQWLYMHNELRRFSINLKIKHQLRSDGLDVGQIKSHDVAQVHPMFMEYFDLIFREHQNYLQKIFKKKNKYGALFMNRNGEAMTDRSYEYSFNELVDMLIEHLLKTGHPRAISEAMDRL